MLQCGWFDYRFPAEELRLWDSTLEPMNLLDMHLEPQDMSEPENR